MREWVPAPFMTYWPDGRRWKLMEGKKELGRVVQLMHNGRWEVIIGPTTFSGYDDITGAALGLLRQLGVKHGQKGSQPHPAGCQ